jgi:two-component system, OmpR family, phosphate regulon response regulator PhoB
MPYRFSHKNAFINFMESVAMAIILIVEDHADIQSLLKITVSRAGYQPFLVATMPEAIAFVEKQLPDAVILDWMLPQGSGLQLLSKWRHDARTMRLPILLLTARHEENDKLNAFQKGADDYLTKPFSTKELIARLQALLRRASRGTISTSPHTERLLIGNFTLDKENHAIYYQGHLLKLNPTELRILQFFMLSPNRAYTRTQLLDYIWGIHAEVEERTVDVHIRRLRKALEPFHAENCIETVRSIGYRFNYQADIAL